MTIPTAWLTATGEGVLPFDTYEAVHYVALYIPADTPISQFTSGTDPLRIRFAGGVGIGLDPAVGEGIDPLPDGVSPVIEVFRWHWLIFQYEAWIIDGSLGSSGSCFFWKLPVGMTLNYQIN